jgi:hypothetical protein
MSESQTEVHLFFKASSELHAAVSSGNKAAADAALHELAGLWLYSPNLKLRHRCAGLLERHGWAAEMARLCFA